jgi:hypothetical protein
MKLPHFHLRLLMVILAGLAVVMGLGIRSARLRERSQYHNRLATDYTVRAGLIIQCAGGDGTDEVLMTIELTPGGGATFRPVSPEAERILQVNEMKRAARQRAYEELAAYHTRCAHEFARAAWRPWLSVSVYPAPVEPEE